MEYKQLAKWLEEKVNDLQARPEYTWHLPLDGDFMIHLGYSDGFDESCEYYYHDKDQRSYCICVKIGERVYDEYEWCYMPWNTSPDGEVWDTDCVITKDADYIKIAKWLLSDYKEMRIALDNGTITF